MTRLVRPLPSPRQVAHGTARLLVVGARTPAEHVRTARRLLRDAADAVAGTRLAVVRAVALLDVVEALVAQIARTAADASAVVASAEALRLDAQAVVQRATLQLDQTERLVAAGAPLLSHLGPSVDRAVHTLRPRHVDAALGLLDLSPEVVDLVVPALSGLGELSPSIDDLAQRFEAVSAIVEGIPGAGLLKRRGTDPDPTPATDQASAHS